MSIEQHVWSTQQRRQQPSQQSSEAPTVTTRETPDLSSLLAWFGLAWLGLAWLGSNLAWLLFIPTSKASKQAHCTSANTSYH
ncbi:hypothetical protein M0804_008600 [Polistes exclamans]|nr:hypothetical protein M0804_008600 [Polistes exclamans]